MSSGIATWPVYDEDEIEAATRVLRSGAVNYWTGAECARFEQEFAGHCDVKHAVAMANGSVALETAIAAVGIVAGDEVVVTPRSFIASAACIIRVGARPVFADVCRDSQNVTAESIESVVSAATKGIVVVHHAGWPCDMTNIMDLARQHDLKVIEDCAQAHGARVGDRPVGGIGDVGVYSFCQDKIISSGGEGGMLVTNDEAVWKRAWSLKDHGKNIDAVFRREHAAGYRWIHDTIGTNLRMTEVQAAIARTQLAKLGDWHARRTAIAQQIAKVMSGYDCMRVPMPAAGITHAWYRLYAFVRESALAKHWSRDRLLEAFNAKGIPVITGSCPEIYKERAVSSLGFAPRKPLPVAQELGRASLAFPVHPTLTDDDTNYICTAIAEIVGEAAVR